MTAAARETAQWAPWERATHFDRAHPRVSDAGGVLLLGLVSVSWITLQGHAPLSEWLCSAGLVVPLVWRRRAPAVVFALLCAVAATQWILGVTLFADVALLVGVATVASERPRRQALAAWAVLEAGVVMASARWSFTGSWVRSLVGLSGLAGVALLAGVVMRTRRAHVAELTERAARLELERDQQAQIAAAAERTRIAREMHDVIAHSLAVIIAMADGASAKVHRDPEQAASAIEAVAQVGRQALGETRRVLGVLRDPSSTPELAPQPGLGRLGDLVEGVRSTGLDASLDLDHLPEGLPAGAELAVYRIVQEATTNVLKHAVGVSQVRVRVGFDRSVVHIEVADDGVPVPLPAGPGAGHGLEGMRERVALYGGEVTAGPGSAGGWVVEATFDGASVLFGSTR